MKVFLLEDDGFFYNYFCMEQTIFDELLERIGQSQENTNWRAIKLKLICDPHVPYYWEKAPS